MFNVTTVVNCQTFCLLQLIAGHLDTSVFFFTSRKSRGYLKERSSTTPKCIFPGIFTSCLIITSIQIDRTVFMCAYTLVLGIHTTKEREFRDTFLMNIDEFIFTDVLHHDMNLKLENVVHHGYDPHMGSSWGSHFSNALPTNKRCEIMLEDLRSELALIKIWGEEGASDLRSGADIHWCAAIDEHSYDASSCHEDFPMKGIYISVCILPTGRCI